MPQIAGKQIKDTSITGGKLVSGTVGTTQLGPTSVTAAKLGNDVTGTGLAGGNGSAIAVNTSTGSVTFTGGTWTFPVDVLQVTGTPDSANDVANKTYVDSAVSGLTWKEPAYVLQYVGNAAASTIEGLTPTAGDAYVVTTADGSGALSTATVGDVWEYSGTAWALIIAGSGGFVPAGIRLLAATQTALISPLTDATDDGKIAVFSGSSNTPSLTTSLNGWAVLITDQDSDGDSIYANNGYVFEGTVPTGTWIQFSGAGQINAGAGLTKSGNTINVGQGNGIIVNADDVAANFASSGMSTVNAGDAASYGTQNDLSRGDHQHAVATGIVGTIQPDDVAAEGSSTNLARADHTHAISCAAAGTIQPDATAAEGSSTSFARADHTHAIVCATPGSIQPDDTAAEGSSTSFARADHTHGIVAAAPTTNLDGSSTNAEGVATSFSRSDHTHALNMAATASDLTTAASAGGSSNNLARQDHTHQGYALKRADIQAGEVTTTNFDETTIQLASTPALDSDVIVFVNGVQVWLANGVSDAQGSSAECYFAPTGDTDGSTAVTIANITTAHYFYWKGTNAGYDLATTDEIKFSYTSVQV